MKSKVKAIDLDTILAKNPHLDRKSVEATLNELRDLQAKGMVRPESISASPPTDPYSSLGRSALKCAKR